MSLQLSLLPLLIPTAQAGVFGTRVIGSTRHLSSANTSAAEAAERLLSTFKGQTTSRKQILDGNQLQRLSLTLNRRELHPGLDVSFLNSAPPNGTPLPPGYHLVYFTPGGVESELGLDGTDRTFNAPRRSPGGCGPAVR